MQITQSLPVKQITLSIISPTAPEDRDAVAAWQQIRQILRQTNELELPRQSHDDIIAGLRTLRESE
jgi:hypothetical protein